MASNQFDVSNQIRQLKKELDVKSTKTRLVAGFYNESLTTKIAKKTKPAFFVDINCDFLQNKHFTGYLNIISSKYTNII